MTFHPAGGVYYVELLEGPFTRTLVGGCIVTQFESLRVPKFGGSRARRVRRKHRHRG